MTDCEACDLAQGRRPLPGGLIHRTTYWRVEHCTGPLGLGSLIVKPLRHVTAVADLTDDEATELGPLLRAASGVAAEVVEADQVYNCLCYVIQPVSRQQMSEYDCYGPALQMAMFSAGALPSPDEVERVAEAARQRFLARRG